MQNGEETYLRSSTIYGPVRSWRLGSSLGVDLLFVNSICSFRCVYCQLGKINVHSSKREVFVSTDRVLDDLKKSRWKEADVITFSGSGEPTMALNLGEAIREIKAIAKKPTVVLTNAAHLNEPDVRRDLNLADKVFCKLDAPDQESFERINKPVAGIDLESIVEGIKLFRSEYEGFLAIQTMYQPLSEEKLERFSTLLLEIDPDEVQLNYPSRSIPREWFLEARGNYDKTPYPAIETRKPAKADLESMANALRKRTGLTVVSSVS